MALRALGGAEESGNAAADSAAVVLPFPRSPWRSLYRAALRLRLRWLPPAKTRLQLESLSGAPIIVLPGVFNGVRLRTGTFLAQTLRAELVKPQARVLDLGTGSGVGAVAAARLGARVIATDINPDAVRCAQINASANYLEHKIETRLGDLFEPVRDERFDVILFNPPYYRGVPENLVDYAWRSPDVFVRFLRELPDRLNPDGKALVVLSSDGDVAAELNRAPGLSVRVVRRRDLINEILTVYELRVKK